MSIVNYSTLTIESARCLLAQKDRRINNLKRVIQYVLNCDMAELEFDADRLRKALEG